MRKTSVWIQSSSVRVQSDLYVKLSQRVNRHFRDLLVWTITFIALKIYVSVFKSQRYYIIRKMKVLSNK